MDDSNKNHLNIVDHGELEEITRPAVKRDKPGSRVYSGSYKDSTATSASSQRFKSGTSLAPSLELLTTEEVMGQSYDLELEDLGSSEYNTDDDDYDTQTDNINTGRTSSIFNIAEPLTDREKKQQQMMMVESSDDEDYMAARQLTLFADESEQDYEVDSDEERSIIREIKNEITNQVRTEMKDELEVYQQAKERLKNVEENEDKNADLNELEPKLKEAIIKMRKLDKVLEKKIKKEKQVKRDRILLQRKLREELDELKGGAKKITTDEQKNTDKFLALELPPSHNEGVTMPVPGCEEPPGTPLFQTQVPDNGRSDESRTDDSKAQVNSSRESVAPGSSLAGESTISGSSTNTRGSTGKQRRNKNKNFIKRNKELASDAQNTIAMTDDEKKRVEDLLENLEELPDIPEEGFVDNTVIETHDAPNPFQVVVMTGEGFLPEEGDSRRLSAIDSRLKMLLPPEDFESIASGSRMENPESRQTMLFTRTLVKSSMDTDIEQLGEQALKDTKEDRDIKQRLKEIELDLDQLSNAVDAEIDSPSLSEGQLQDLLNECARTMSRATQETDSLALSSSRSSIASSRASIMENPPKLPDEVLQQLLADARKSGIGSSASLHQPENISLHNEENLVLESVSADTIKELLRDSRTTSRSTSQNDFVSKPQTPTSENLVLESMSADKIKELFRDSGNTSRNSSQNDFASKPQTPLQRPKDTHSMFSNGLHQNSGPLPKRSFLPEIDPKGTLTQRSNSQRLNDEDYHVSRPSSGRASTVMLRNSLSDGCNISVSDESAQTPHPPSEGRKSSGGRIRTISPFTKNHFDE